MSQDQFFFKRLQEKAAVLQQKYKELESTRQQIEVELLKTKASYDTIAEVIMAVKNDIANQSTAAPITPADVTLQKAQEIEPTEEEVEQAKAKAKELLEKNKKNLEKRRAEEEKRHKAAAEVAEKKAEELKKQEVEEPTKTETNEVIGEPQESTKAATKKTTTTKKETKVDETKKEPVAVAAGKVEGSTNEWSEDSSSALEDDDWGP